MRGLMRQRLALTISITLLLTFSLQGIANTLIPEPVIPQKLKLRTSEPIGEADTVPVAAKNDIAISEIMSATDTRGFPQWIELHNRSPRRVSRKRESIRAAVYASQGISKIRTNRYEEAITNFDKAIELNLEKADAYYNRGLAKFRLGDLESTQGNTEEARRLYEAGISDQGDTAGVEALYVDAVRDCTRAIQLNPENAAAYGNRGVAKVARGNAEGAIEDFDAAIRLNPEYAEYFYERAQAKEALGQKEAAKTDFEKAKELDPNVGQ